MSMREGTKTVPFHSYQSEEMCAIMREKLLQANQYLELKLTMQEKLIRFSVGKI